MYYILKGDFSFHGKGKEGGESLGSIKLHVQTAIISRYVFLGEKRAEN